MPTEVKWLDEAHTIVYVAVIDTWTRDEFVVMRDTARSYIDQANQPVDEIIDLTRIRQLPADAMHQARDSLVYFNPNLGITVFLINTVVILSLYRLFTRLYPQVIEKRDFRIAQTVDEALRLIYEQRQRGKC